MPRLTNKITGESYHITKEEWARLKSPAYLQAFEVSDVDEPTEVTALKEKKAIENSKRVKKGRKANNDVG